MTIAPPQDCIAFQGHRRIGRGAPAEVALAARMASLADSEPVLMFDAVTARPVEFDLRGSEAGVLARLPQPAAEPRRGPGRPKLGVAPREVTLLPRHWDWLNTQPGGASAALRRLVEDARRAAEGPDRKRASQEAAYRFLSALAGDLAGFEEATRALFAGDRNRFEALTAGWPADVREHGLELAADALAEG